MNAHKNVVQFLGVCRSPKFLIVTELCEQGSLRKLLNDRSFDIPFDLQLQWIAEVAAGMFHLVCEGVIHKGICPLFVAYVHSLASDLAARNVLVTQHLNAKVSDFGMSKLVDYKATGSASVYVGYHGFGKTIVTQYN